MTTIIPKFNKHKNWHSGFLGKLWKQLIDYINKAIKMKFWRFFHCFSCSGQSVSHSIDKLSKFRLIYLVSDASINSGESKWFKVYLAFRSWKVRVSMFLENEFSSVNSLLSNQRLIFRTKLCMKRKKNLINRLNISEWNVVELLKNVWWTISQLFRVFRIFRFFRKCREVGKLSLEWKFMKLWKN